VAGTPAEDILRNRGDLYLYRHKDALQPTNFAFSLRKRRGVVVEVLDRDAIERRSPFLAGRGFEAGAYFPNAFYTKDPKAFTRTLLDELIAKGGTLRRAQVTGFEAAGGRVRRVRTDDGDLAGGSVVIAAGPWSRSLLRQLGSDVPLDVERGYGVDIPDPGFTLDLPIVLDESHVAITPHRTGIRLVGIDELASISAPADLKVTNRLVNGLKRSFPEVSLEGATRWMRRRPSMPDSLPVIDRAPRSENAYLAFGHGHKGLGMAAITGQLVQQLMDGQATTVEVTPFRATRFRTLSTQ
jgi:D-amino-acid dehydrogenase